MGKILVAKWKIRESETPRVLKMLPELAEKTRSEKGNVAYAIYQSESNPSELILHEEYVDAAAADAHRQSEHYQRIVAHGIIPHLEVREVIRVVKLI